MVDRVETLDDPERLGCRPHVPLQTEGILKHQSHSAQDVSLFCGCDYPQKTLRIFH